MVRNSVVEVTVVVLILGPLEVDVVVEVVDVEEGLASD